jgi:hypothetical protein
MLAVVALVLLTLVWSQWLVEPFVAVLRPLLSLSWLGWALLALGLWLFAARRPD